MSDSDGKTKKSRGKVYWVKLSVQILIVAAIVWGIRRTIFGALEQIDDYPWSRADPNWFWWLVAAGVLYLLGLAPMGCFWYRALRVMGQTPKLGETMRAYYIGHLGKYVPGKALVVILRAGLLRSQRVDTGLAAASVFLETLTMMAVGAMLAAATIGIWFHEQTVLLWVAIGLAIAAGGPIVPGIFRRLARLARVGRSNPEVSKKLDAIDWPLMITGAVTMACGWLVMALSLWAVVRALGIEGVELQNDWPVFVASVTLAMVAGFLSLIPGGLGVRDLILFQIMVPFLARFVPEGEEQVAAMVAAVLLRLVWLVAELLISGVLYLTVGKQE